MADKHKSRTRGRKADAVKDWVRYWFSVGTHCYDPVETGRRFEPLWRDLLEIVCAVAVLAAVIGLLWLIKQ